MIARGVAVLVAVAALAAPAAAYPYYRFSSGTDRCGECHATPSGGGVLTPWGRGELGDTLARGGDGAFAHGALELPEWLALGGGLRLATLVGDDGAVRVFPMQLEVAARVEHQGFSVQAALGARSAARPAGARSGDSAGGFGGLAAISREHVLGYQPDGAHYYLRLGRFAPAFGLRLADHTAYVRRYLGMGLYDEPYAVGGGWLGDATELHVAASISDPWQWPRPRELALTAMIDHRAGPRAFAASVRTSTSDLERRAVVGVSASVWLDGPDLVLMAEVDGGVRMFPDADVSQPLAAAWLGPTWLPVRGLAITAAVEAWLPDAGRLDTGRLALAPAISFWPWAHVELAASARLQQVGADDRAASALLQLHYLP